MANDSYISNQFDIRELSDVLNRYVSTPFPDGENLLDSITPNTNLGLIRSVIEQYKKNALGVELIMPLKIGVDANNLWEMPVEPTISIVGGHIIARRYPNQTPAKQVGIGGSVKERWSSDDYTITIKGRLTDPKQEKYPELEVKLLESILAHRNNVIVESVLFRLFGINRIAIHQYPINYTAGLTHQDFEIQAWSDNQFDSLLIDR